MGDHICYVDSGEAVADVVADMMAEQGLLRTASQPRTEEFYVTDSDLYFRRVAESFLGRPLEAVTPVELGAI